MIKINLLPHREAKRKQKKAAFIALMALMGIGGAVIVITVGGYNARQISVQEQRNSIIRNANTELDKTIAEIATLEQEIEALKARQEAVEDLQGDRNQPVFLLDELVKQTPAGVYLREFKQEGQRVELTGNAQSQARVAELLRNLATNSPWLEKPDLTVVRSVSLDKDKGAKTARKVVEFKLTVGIKRPRDKDAALAEAAGTTGDAAAQAANAKVDAAAPGLATTPAAK